MKLNRRDFILSASGFVLASRLPVFGQDKKKHVIVAGAGLAGLATAYELSAKGFDVTVIEGRNRIGGRVHTLRKPFTDDLQVETGGELIGDGYKRMLGYADKFGVEYQPLSEEVETGGSVAEIQDGIGRTAYLKGKLYERGANFKPHPYGLKGDEAKVLPPTLYGTNIRKFINEVRRNNKTLADFDKLSLADALRQNKVSEKAIELMNISLNYNSIETVSTGGVLFDSTRRRTAGVSRIKIVGGNDLLPKALAENAVKNGTNIILSAKIKKISQNDKNVVVTYQNEDGQIQTLQADKLVCTIPFSVLKEVEFSPCLPYQKTKAINELDYTQNTKVYLQAQYTEWDKRALGSSIWTDTPIERIFSSTGKIGDEKAILTIWTDGDGSKTLEKMDDQMRIGFAQKKFEEILPFMKGSVEKTHTLSWSQDEFARGTYSHLKVGQLMTIQPHIKTAVGNIHFAGEHTAEISPGMEGAFESAERVVKEISG
jgi:monoamine oxidase